MENCEKLCTFVFTADWADHFTIGQEVSVKFVEDGVIVDGVAKVIREELSKLGYIKIDTISADPEDIIQEMFKPLIREFEWKQHSTGTYHSLFSSTYEDNEGILINLGLTQGEYNFCWIVDNDNKLRTIEDDMDWSEGLGKTFKDKYIHFRNLVQAVKDGLKVNSMNLS